MAKKLPDNDAYGMFIANPQYFLGVSIGFEGNSKSANKTGRFAKGGMKMDIQSRVSRAKPLVAGAQDKLYNMKYETASELAVNIPNQNYWGDVSSRDCGRVGGNMVRKLIALGKQHL